MQSQSSSAIPARLVDAKETARLSLQYIPITSEGRELHRWLFIPTLYSQRSLLNLQFHNLQLEDYQLHFHSDRFHLSRLRLNGLALSNLPLNIIEYIISTLLALHTLELRNIRLTQLDDRSLRLIYDFLLYLIYKGTLIDIELGTDISEAWRIKLHNLFNNSLLPNSISKEFHALMTARLSDRQFYTNKFHEYEAELSKNQREQQSLVAQLATKSQTHDALASQIQKLNLENEQTKKDNADKEAELIAQIKSMQDQLTNQQTVNETLKKTVGENAAFFQNEIVLLRTANDALENALSQYAKIKARFPALLPLISLVPTQDTKIDAEPSSSLAPTRSSKRRKTTRDEKLEVESMPDSKEVPEEEQQHESFYALLRAAEESVDKKLKVKVTALATNWLVNKVLTKNLQVPIVEYISQQLEIAEVIISNGISFYEIPTGQAESIFHYLAFILCKISNTPDPLEDHQHERQLLLQTIANAFTMIETLHKRFVSMGITIGEKNAEIKKLSGGVTELIMQNNAMRPTFFTPAVTITMPSSSSSPLQKKFS